MTSGDRLGHFIDGTFLHPWIDLDSAVAPAADAGDNTVNVLPYADVRSSGTYETLSPLERLPQEGFKAALMTFVSFDVAVGREAEFEARVLSAPPPPIGYAVLRPANGATQYLLLLSAANPSQLALHARFVTSLLQATRSPEAGALLRGYKTETARYRPDLSYVPVDPR